MPSRDWFALGVRLLGLWALYYAFANVLHLGTSVLGLSPESTVKEWNDVHSLQMYNLFYVAAYLAFATYLLLGAEHLTRWVYSEPSPQSDSDSGSSPE